MFCTRIGILCDSADVSDRSHFDHDFDRIHFVDFSLTVSLQYTSTEAPYRVPQYMYQYCTSAGTPGYRCTLVQEY